MEAYYNDNVFCDSLFVTYNIRRVRRPEKLSLIWTASGVNYVIHEIRHEI